MVDKVIENNRVSIIGEIVSDFRYSHQVYGEGFYIVDVSVNRLSDLSDIIPMMVCIPKIGNGYVNIHTDNERNRRKLC